MRCASISVGIVDYEASYYRESAMRLRFAASDAMAFHRYLEEAFASDGPDAAGVADDRHVLLTNRDATGVRVAAAFERLAAAGRVDVLIVYLTGHGERGGGDGGWFCLVDADPDKPSLDGPGLDGLLDKVDAGQVLVVVDCCYAEATFRHSRYFARLDTSVTRLLIASSRAHQQAWEDDTLQRSIFSEVVLRACSSELHVRDAGGMIDVERALLPYLRAQVVLLTAANKSGLVQEPVTGGLSALPLMLPSVRGRAFGRPLSLADTVRARLRQVLIGIAGTALAALALVHMMTYHLVVDSAGIIQVRTGLATTANLLPSTLVGQIDSGYSVAQLDSRQTTFLAGLSRGVVRGIGTHLDDLGLKTWAAQLTPFLKAPDRARYDVLVRGQPARFEPSQTGAPLDEAQFLLDKNTGMTTLQLSHMYPIDRPDPPDCMTDPARKIDFTVLDPRPRVASADALWWIIRPGPGAQQIALFDRLIATAAYRMLHQKDGAAVRYEGRYLALTLQALAAQATPATLATMRQHALAMLPTHCGLHAALALGVVAQDGQGSVGAQAEAVLAHAIASQDRATQGDLATAQQELAADALMPIATHRPLNGATLDIITALVLGDDGDIGGGTFAQSLLLALAERQALPARIMAHLDARLRRLPDDDHSFGKLGILRVLACNARFLPSARRRELERLLAGLAGTAGTYSIYQEALGFAGREGLQSAIAIRMLSVQLSPATLFPVPATTYRGETLISSDDDTAAIALGRIAQRFRLEASLQERLARVAAARHDMSERTALVAGLAYQRYGNEAAIADAIYNNLADAGADARWRALEVEVACTALTGWTGQARRGVAKRLLERWRQESAPERRLALATTIGRSRLPAIGQINLCGGLPEVVAD
jgi:hypothetical protein